jgi:hypothetical protein
VTVGDRHDVALERPASGVEVSQHSPVVLEQTHPDAADEVVALGLRVAPSSARERIEATRDRCLDHGQQTLTEGTRGVPVARMRTLDVFVPHGSYGAV